MKFEMIEGRQCAPLWTDGAADVYLWWSSKGNSSHHSALVGKEEILSLSNPIHNPICRSSEAFFCSMYHNGKSFSKNSFHLSAWLNVGEDWLSTTNSPYVARDAPQQWIFLACPETPSPITFAKFYFAPFPIQKHKRDPSNWKKYTHTITSRSVVFLHPNLHDYLNNLAGAINI